MYRVEGLREDSLQLPRPNPAVQQQARPRRVTTAYIHIYGFKQKAFRIYCERILFKGSDIEQSIPLSIVEHGTVRTAERMAVEHVRQS